MLSNGRPIVEKLSSNQYDVLVKRDGHRQKCVGCHYAMCRIPGPNCIGQCEDTDHIMWIHHNYADIPKDQSTVIKRAHLFDTLVDVNGKEWLILEDANHRIDVAPKFAEMF